MGESKADFIKLISDDTRAEEIESNDDVRVSKIKTHFNFPMYPKIIAESVPSRFDKRTAFKTTKKAQNNETAKM